MMHTFYRNYLEIEYCAIEIPPLGLGVRIVQLIELGHNHDIKSVFIICLDCANSIMSSTIKSMN